MTPEEVVKRRRYSYTVAAYVAARELYREYRGKNRPPEVAALYKQAKALMDATRSQG